MTFLLRKNRPACAITWTEHTSVVWYEVSVEMNLIDECLSRIVLLGDGGDSDACYVKDF